jgi:AmmeMemoRadiSam system protein B
MQSAKIRPPAAAGLFYSGNPHRLRAEIEGLLADAPASSACQPKHQPKERPKAVIAPHAGYVYSGKIAATAFATLRDIAKDITRVVVIGPAHYLALRGIAVPTVEAFETPFGPVPPMLPSTHSRSSCRSCRWRSERSRSCRCSSATPSRKKWRKHSGASGVARRR